MSVDTTFKPLGPTTLVGVTAVAPMTKDAAGGVTTFRLRCLATAYLTWGPSSSITAAGAPSAGTPSSNTIGMTTGGNAAYIEVPAGSFFISSVAASFEVTPGSGGTGG